MQNNIDCQQRILVEVKILTLQHTIDIIPIISLSFESLSFAYCCFYSFVTIIY